MDEQIGLNISPPLVRSAIPRRRQRRLDAFLGRDWKVALIFVIPIVILMGGLIVWPFINAVSLSFTTRSLITRTEQFVGFDNYMRLLRDTDFLVSIRNTFVFTFASVGIKFVVGMAIALLLHSRIPFRNVLTGLMLLPWIIPEVVTALAWRSIYDPIFGGFNPILRELGLLSPGRNIAWLAEPGLAMASVIAVNVWKGIPFYTILLLAGLKAIDREHYEAAEVDGADTVQRFRHITLPGLRYVILVTLLLSFINTFNTFGLIYLMTGGGPGGATRMFSILAYEKAIVGLRFGPGVATAFSMAPLMALLIFVLARVMRPEEHRGSNTNVTTMDRVANVGGRSLGMALDLLFLPFTWFVAQLGKMNRESSKFIIADFVTLLSALAMGIAFSVMAWVNRGVDVTGLGLLSETSAIFQGSLLLIAISTGVSVLCALWGLLNPSARPATRRIAGVAGIIGLIFIGVFFIQTRPIRIETTFLMGAGFWIGLFAAVGLVAQIFIPGPVFSATRQRRMTRAQRERVGIGARIILLLPILLFVLFPLYWIVITSFKTDLQIQRFTSIYWPDPFTLEQHRSLLVDTPFLLWFRNTLIVASTSTAISVIVAAMAAYALARLKFLGAGLLTTLLLVTYLLPGSLLFIPLYRILTDLGLINSFGALILTYPTFLMPFATWVMLGYFRSIPVELEEAAMIDGTTRFMAFWKITLPLAAPALLSVTLFAFTNAWNEFLFAFVFVTSEKFKTLPVGLQLLVFGDIYPWGQLMAASLLMAIPVVVMYTYAQRYLVEGLTAGSVKG
jgi:ABC-type glycerol-3-phosphate transport system permease component